MATASPLTSHPTQRILGIDFFVGSMDAAVDCILEGGLVVAPSGPGLAVDLMRSSEYRQALQTADLAITDSGYMILLWRLFQRQKLPRLSGLRFLRVLLERSQLKSPGSVFWVMPSEAESVRNRTWLEEQGYPITDDDIYIAPFYGKDAINDPELLSRIETRKPQIVMMCIGGGVQERVGLFLRESLSCKPGIACLGAAIAFLTGGQTNIPPWGDKVFLGWLLRILSDPKKFGPRYWNSIRLAPILFRYREHLPPLQAKSRV
ncbi:WecB/TagA/CpsF family glycosyltransferase [Synoicihabitans lomoniglobus]|uniref:WecB/TagA/CpsF family glycosyltransferase n=1 Tax=Synoicihabitans lomoniglobus TaxID=2909285 RepID=A0AAF0CQT1_9BACT|nr:WecB/TagA/CpsF family glycosyltransferase [Opitutaceae bacterium LMO-M01]WED66370.1 WecB/TagA/CpsF family glycosyltransferase [Opitutaceae bacterium LMO-M01]